MTGKEQTIDEAYCGRCGVEQDVKFWLSRRDTGSGEGIEAYCGSCSTKQRTDVFFRRYDEKRRRDVLSKREVAHNKKQDMLYEIATGDSGSYNPRRKAFDGLDQDHLYRFGMEFCRRNRRKGSWVIRDLLTAMSRIKNTDKIYEIFRGNYLGAERSILTNFGMPKEDPGYWFDNPKNVEVFIPTLERLSDENLEGVMRLSKEDLPVLNGKVVDMIMERGALEDKKEEPVHEKTKPRGLLGRVFGGREK